MYTYTTILFVFFTLFHLTFAFWLKSCATQQAKAYTFCIFNKFNKRETRWAQCEVTSTPDINLSNWTLKVICFSFYLRRENFFLFIYTFFFFVQCRREWNFYFLIPSAHVCFAWLGYSQLHMTMYPIYIQTTYVTTQGYLYNIYKKTRKVFWLFCCIWKKKQKLKEFKK